MSRSNERVVPFAALLALAAHIACGDVTSELITDGSGGSTTGGGPTGGSGAGGSSSGGAAGSGGTPPCTTSDDCSGSERNICRASDGVCVECIDEGQCDPDEDCSEHMGECARPCASDSDCIEADDSRCDTAIGFCAECVDDDHCPTGEVCGNWECNEP